MKREKDIKNSHTHLREEGIVLQSIWGEKSEKNLPLNFTFSFCFCSDFFQSNFCCFSFSQFDTLIREYASS